MPFCRPNRGLDRMRLVVYETADTVLLCSVGLDGEIGYDTAKGLIQAS